MNSYEHTYLTEPTKVDLHASTHRNKPAKQADQNIVKNHKIPCNIKLKNPV